VEKEAWPLTAEDRLGLRQLQSQLILEKLHNSCRRSRRRYCRRARRGGRYATP
jgi:hypothetical protein